jgi:Ca2+-binding EF-hand superfamily protein
MSNNIQEKKEKLINDIFNMYDIENSGNINSGDVRSLLLNMGYKPSNEDIIEFLKLADKSNSGIISKENFIKAIHEKYTIPLNQLDEIKEAFNIFDMDKDGKISFKELKNILKHFGENNNNDEEINKIMKFINVDENGLIDINDFIKKWKF